MTTTAQTFTVTADELNDLAHVAIATVIALIEDSTTDELPDSFPDLFGGTPEVHDAAADAVARWGAHRDRAAQRSAPTAYHYRPSATTDEAVARTAAALAHRVDI